MRGNSPRGSDSSVQKGKSYPIVGKGQVQHFLIDTFATNPTRKKLAMHIVEVFRGMLLRKSTRIYLWLKGVQHCHQHCDSERGGRRGGAGGEVVGVWNGASHWDAQINITLARGWNCSKVVATSPRAFMLDHIKELVRVESAYLKICNLFFGWTPNRHAWLCWFITGSWTTLACLSVELCGDVVASTNSRWSEQTLLIFSYFWGQMLHV